jgi:hypothetical protein
MVNVESVGYGLPEAEYDRLMGLGQAPYAFAPQL